jgi:hypothetical protein
MIKGGCGSACGEKLVTICSTSPLALCHCTLTPPLASGDPSNSALVLTNPFLNDWYNFLSADPQKRLDEYSMPSIVIYVVGQDNQLLPNSSYLRGRSRDGNQSAHSAFVLSL